MNPRTGPLARRPSPLLSALLITLVVPPMAALAQEGEDTATGATATSSPGRLEQASHPRGGLGQRVFDLIEGGPGYIAVGGRTPTGLDHRAFVWLSDDGLRWKAAPLFGDAALGTMRGVAPLPDDSGYVAVGHDFVPQDERAELTHAIVWYSVDGFGWQRVPADESFPGSIMWDITATPDGVAVAGCVAGFHCDVGRVWTSVDGFEWELVDDIAMAPYDITADADGELVIGGEDDAYDLVNGQASAASSVEDWAIHTFATGDSQIHGATPYGDGFLLVGTLSSMNDGSVIGSSLQRSEDGVTWNLVEPARLQGVYSLDIDASGDLVTLIGRDHQAKRNKPLVLWTRDLDTLEPVKLPRKLDVDAFGGEDVRLTDEGMRLFVFGTNEARPAIWTTTFE